MPDGSVEKPDWESMSQESAIAEQVGDPGGTGKYVAHPPQTQPKLKQDRLDDGGVENASGEPLSIPQKPVRLGASTEAAVEGSSDSGKPIRLHELQESGAGGNGSADQPHRHASNPNHGPFLPLTGSDPFSARRSERIVTYLEPDSSLRSGNEREQPADMDAERIAIGDAAEKAVVKYEIRARSHCGTNAAR